MSNLSNYQERLLPTLLAAVETNAAARESLPVTPPSRSRRSRLARGGVAVLAAALVTATGALLMRPNPAFAVTTLGNGLVRIEFDRDFGDADALAHKLRDVGVNVGVVGVHEDECVPGKIFAIAYGIPNLFPSTPNADGSKSVEAKVTDDQLDPYNIIVEIGDNYYVLDTTRLKTSVDLYVTQPDGPSLQDSVRDADDPKFPLVKSLVVAGCSSIVGERPSLNDVANRGK